MNIILFCILDVCFNLFFSYSSQTNEDQFYQFEAAAANTQELVEVNEAYRQISEASSATVYLQQAATFITKPSANPNYCTNGNIPNLDGKGFVSLDNAVYKDNLSHKEFTELLHILLTSRTLLTSPNLSNEQVRQKRLLLALLVSLNWGIKDPFDQARLIRAIQKRIDESKILRNKE